MDEKNPYKSIQSISYICAGIFLALLTIFNHNKNIESKEQLYGQYLGISQALEAFENAKQIFDSDKIFKFIYSNDIMIIEAMENKYSKEFHILNDNLKKYKHALKIEIENKNRKFLVSPYIDRKSAHKCIVIFSEIPKTLLKENFYTLYYSHFSRPCHDTARTKFPIILYVNKVQIAEKIATSYNSPIGNRKIFKCKKNDSNCFEFDKKNLFKHDIVKTDKSKENYIIRNAYELLNANNHIESNNPKIEIKNRISEINSLITKNRNDEKILISGSSISHRDATILFLFLGTYFSYLSCFWKKQAIKSRNLSNTFFGNRQSIIEIIFSCIISIIPIIVALFSYFMYSQNDYIYLPNNIISFNINWPFIKIESNEIHNLVQSNLRENLKTKISIANTIIFIISIVLTIHILIVEIKFIITKLILGK